MIRFRQKNFNTDLPNKTITYYWTRPTATFDPDAVAFFNATGITDATIKNAINTLVIDLKGYGIWNKMIAIYPFVGGTASTHKFNLKDPRDLDIAFRLTFFGGWTHTLTGTRPNGTNAYADTYINAFNLFSAGNGYAGLYLRTLPNLGGDRYPLGGGNILIDLYNSGNNIFPKMGGAAFLDRPTSGPRAFWQLNNLSGAQTITKNSTVLGTNTNTGGFTNQTVFLGASNNSPNPPSGYSDYEQSLTSIGVVGLTPTERTNYYTAVQAFQTTLGRQV